MIFKLLNNIFNHLKNIIFKYALDEIVRYKIWLETKCYCQVVIVDFNAIFVPVAKFYHH
jgi:hypothetical protein